MNRRDALRVVAGAACAPLVALVPAPAPRRSVFVTAANAIRVDGSAVTQPVSGRMVLLSPVPDSWRTGWVNRIGGEQRLFDAVNNAPPRGEP